MKKFLLGSIIFYGVCLVFSSSLAKEITSGEIRYFGRESQIVSVYFKGIRGRLCLVDIKAIKNGREVFSENISFDWEREERILSIGEKKMLIFYVVKGLTVYLDDREI